MKRAKLPPWDTLNHLFVIDDTSPSGLRWKNVRKNARVKPGEIAGHGRVAANGKVYWELCLHFNGKQHAYKAHRIIYYLNTQNDPVSFDIDHKTNQSNTVENLRVATNSQNQANKTKQKTYKGKQTTSEYKGVIFRKDKQKRQWQARIRYNKKLINIGMFDDEQEAAKAYDKKAVELYGEYARLNFDDEKKNTYRG